MLTELTLEAFKAFDALRLDLAPLTVLSGLNSAGKSTVLQSLALLGQTMEQREWGNEVLLDGTALRLGSVRDVVNQRVGRRSFSIGMRAKDEDVRWTFASDDRLSLSLSLEKLVWRGRNRDVTPPLRWLLPAGEAEASSIARSLRGLHWLTAERMGPREVLPLREKSLHQRVGPRGELAAGTLHWHGELNVSHTLRVPDEPPMLLHQTQAWMRAFFPGCALRVVPVDGASSVTLQFRTDEKTEFHRPQNVGFGLSQLFPLIVAVLAARPGDLLLIENPEVHLHPRGQQEIGAFLARAASGNVQVIVETHSDHVLNGIRIAVKEGLVPAADVAVHFFGLAENGHPGANGMVSPRIDADGRLDRWPEGFFDQLDVALQRLI